MIVRMVDDRCGCYIVEESGCDEFEWLVVWSGEGSKDLVGLKYHGTLSHGTMVL
jgi:hypothetical protein